MTDYQTLHDLDLAHCFHPSTDLPAHHKRGPMIFAEGNGMWLKDIHGKEYLDCQAGLANCNFGHGNEEVAQAAYDQMRQLQFTTSGNGLASKPLIELTTKLGQMLSPDLTRILVMSGGSEVNEAAIKLSRYLNRLEGRPEKNKVISRKLAYHGSTVGTVPTTDVLTFAQAASPLPPGYLKIDPPDSYRCSFCSDQPKCNLECARELETTIIREGPETVAAFIGEPVMQFGAQFPADGYWQSIREICDRYQVFLIMDEVITGLGRTGKLFAFQHWGVWPDLLTFSKALGAGYYPVGVLAAREGIYQRLLNAAPDAGLWHFFTFSGTAVGSAVGLKALEIIERLGLVENARIMGDRLLRGLNSLREFDMVGDVQGIGLLNCVKLVGDKETKEPAPKQLSVRIEQLTRDRGLLVRLNPARGMLWVTPPLIVEAAHVDRAVATLRECLAIVQDEMRNNSF